MAMRYVCPYWDWEKKLNMHCQMAVMKFPDQKTREVYIRKYCTCVEGWENCSIAKTLNERYEKETGK